MKRIYAAVLPLSMMFGCSSIELPYTANDKASSISDHLDKRITRYSVSTNEQGVRSENTTVYDIPSYLLTHTGRIVSSKRVNPRNIVADVTSTIEESQTLNEQDQLASRMTTASHSHHLDVDSLEKSTFGQAVIVSNDGYFLTAAHVVDSGQSLLLFNLPDAESLQVLPTILPFRTVLRDNRGDLAIIKADISVPEHIDLDEGEPTAGELLFAGGWNYGNGGVGGGRLQQKHRSRNLNRKGTSVIHWATSIPLLPGDSGSGVITEDGKLRGIVIQLTENASIIAATDAETIGRVIEADRNEQATKE